MAGIIVATLLFGTVVGFGGGLIFTSLCVISSRDKRGE